MLNFSRRLIRHITCFIFGHGSRYYLKPPTDMDEENFYSMREELNLPYIKFGRKFGYGWCTYCGSHVKEPARLSNNKKQSYIINVAKDFSRFPAGRYITDGPNSGERLSQVIAAALATNEYVTINFDGTFGYGSNFLEEAFGGLVSNYWFKPSDLKSRITFISDDESLIKEILSYL